MTKLLVRRRPDGVIELRRPRLRDDPTVREVGVLLGMCFGCVVFIAVLAALLVESPVVLAATAAFALPVVPAVLLARSAQLTPAAARPPPRPPDRAA